MHHHPPREIAAGGFFSAAWISACIGWGETGKGFTVVVDQVKSLADRMLSDKGRVLDQAAEDFMEALVTPLSDTNRYLWLRNGQMRDGAGSRI